MSSKTLELTLEKIADPNNAPSDSIRQMQRQRLSAKDARLGQIDALSTKLVEITGLMTPQIYPNATVICAADHGVFAEGVTNDTPESTTQVIQSVLHSNSPTAALAHKLETKIRILNVGAAAKLPEHENLVNAKVRSGTRNFSKEPSMSQAEVFASISAGIKLAQDEFQNGARFLLIANVGAACTTSGAAIAAVLTGLEIQEVTGAGSGIGLKMWRHKCQVIEEALLLHAPSSLDGMDILTKIGGLEIAAIVGIILEATASRVPILLDGLVPAAAAAVATLFEPTTRKVLIAAHRTSDPGHGALLDFLDLTPILDLDIQCREGAGALLALPMLEAALATNL